MASLSHTSVATLAPDSTTEKQTAPPFDSDLPMRDLAPTSSEVSKPQIQPQPIPPSSSPGPTSLRKYDFYFVPIPPSCRLDPSRPFKFTLLLNVCFGFCSTFTVANLYYCQPILDQLAASFGVTYAEISNVPTLTQAGYATGLLLISPLGDLLRRRSILLSIVFLSASFTIGLATTNSLRVFEALSFIVGIFTVTPQVLIPLTAELAPPHRRASAMSIVISGLMLGLLFARVLSGIIAEFSNWRNVYYMAIGMQSLIVALLWWTIPDYETKAAGTRLGYLEILWTMGKYVLTEPILVQSCLINAASNAIFTSFWVTLTFLLAGPPYQYSTLDTGLFGLVGILGVIAIPFVGRGLDKLIHWVGAAIGLLVLAICQALDVSAAGVNVAAVVLVCFLLDVGFQTQQVANAARVMGINPAARSRLNAVYIIFGFFGQVMGTSTGARLFTSSGWRAQAGLSLGLVGAGFVVLLVRGPHSKRWIGWDGGFELRKGRIDSAGKKEGSEGREGGEVEKGLEEGQVESLGKEGVEGEGETGSGGEDRRETVKVDPKVDPKGSREAEGVEVGELGGGIVHERVHERI